MPSYLRHQHPTHRADTGRAVVGCVNLWGLRGGGKQTCLMGFPHDLQLRGFRGVVSGEMWAD